VRRAIATACAFFAAAIAGAITANAQTTGDFYKDKTLSLVVGYGVGGGYDVYARLLARHIARHIPGTPTVIVQNMPGAGSLTALRHQDAIAPKDGTVVTLFDFVQIINARLNPERTKLDLARYSFIGSISEDLSVCYVWHTRGIDTLDDLRKAAVVHMGLTAAGSMQDIRFKVLSRMLGVNVKPVLGYAGTAQQYIATVAENMPRNVPYAGDLVAGERDRRVLRLLSNPAQLGKPFVVSAQVAPERTAILRAAFDAAMKDPQLRKEAEKLLIDISPKSAAESTAIVDDINAMPADTVDMARKVIAD